MRDLFMMTAYIPDSKRQAKRQPKVPTVIQRYNNMMGGVDRSDQMTTFYPNERK